MFSDHASWHNKSADFKDKKHPLFVSSVGTYQLHTRPKLPTHRPRGRLDFQILYIASGIAHFYFDGIEHIVTAGNMVIYRPREEQRYYYYGVDHTVVYWLHFTGNNVTNILRKYGIPDDTHCIHTGTSLVFKNIFMSCLQELKDCRPHYETILANHLENLFIIIGRSINRDQSIKNEYLQGIIDRSTRFFHDHYNEAIAIDDYAASIGMSVSWFIRNFKEYTGMTPAQFLIAIRMSKAQSLLETSSMNITEISHLIGYENPLYFSRLFKKQYGFSPKEFRKQIHLS